MDIHLALLRGINLGSKNRLPMKDLAAMFTDAPPTEEPAEPAADSA